MPKKILIFLISIFIFLSQSANAYASGAPVQGNSSYTTPSSEAPANGSSTETVSVHLQDASQSNVVGDNISLTSSNDSTAIFPQNNQTTDSNGNATFTVTSLAPGTTNITLTDSTNPATFTDWFTISFYDATKGCVNNPTAPVLSSVVSNSNNTATLTWTDSADPVSNYLVSYGVTSKGYIYGDPNVGNQGTTNFTVGALTGGKKYYFVVAANNNCGTSGFSNEVSVVVNPIPITPGPTTSPTIQPTATPSTPTYIVSDTPTVTPLPTDVPTPIASNQDINSTFKNLGIGIVTAGILLIGAVYIFQKSKKNNQTPPRSINPPTEGILQPPQDPFNSQNIPQQPY